MNTLSNWNPSIGNIFRVSVIRVLVVLASVWSIIVVKLIFFLFFFLVAAIPAGVTITHMSTQIKAAVDEEQNKLLWVPVVNP